MAYYRIRSSRASTANIGPDTEQIHKEIAGEFGGQHLRDDVEIGDESRLQNDGNVRGVEELDRIRAGLTTVSGRFDGQVDAEALEIDDNGEDEHSSEQIGEIGQVLAVEGLLESAHLVVACGQQVKERNDGALELGAAACVYCRWTERLPYDCLADVCRNEERDTRAKTVAFLQQLVQEQHNKASNEQLNFLH